MKKRRVEQVVIGVGGSSIWGGAFAGSISWMASVSEVTTELLGVPLSVFMGAIAGALLARSTADPSIPFFRAAMATLVWIMAGCVSAPVSLAAAEHFGYKLPNAALAFLGLMVSSFGPRLYPIALDGSAAFLKRWIDKSGGPDAK